MEETEKMNSEQPIVGLNNVLKAMAGLIVVAIILVILVALMIVVPSFQKNDSGRYGTVINDTQSENITYHIKIWQGKDVGVLNIEINNFLEEKDIVPCWDSMQTHVTQGLQQVWVPNENSNDEDTLTITVPSKGHYKYDADTLTLYTTVVLQYYRLSENS